MKRNWKTFSVEEKLKILNYCDEFTTLGASKNFKVSRSVIYKWKTDLKKGGTFALEWGNSTTVKSPEERKRFKINLKNNKYETMSREELIERAKLGDALKKHETRSTKSRYFTVDLVMFSHL